MRALPSDDSTDRILRASVLQKDARSRHHALIAATVDSELSIAATVSGLIFVVFGIIDGISHPGEASWRVPIAEVPGALLLVTALLAWRHRHPVRWSPWIYGMLVLVAAVSTVGTVLLGEQQEELVYCLLIMTAGAAAVPLFEIFVPLVVVTSAGFLWALHDLHLSSDLFQRWMLAWVTGVAAALYVLMSRRHSLRLLSEAERHIERLAVTDPLTGVLNRNGLRMMGVELLALAHRQDQPVFALFVDVDGLKHVNDVAGHEAGDTVISLVGVQLESMFRRGDLVARWGGDEFVVVGMGQRLDADTAETRLDSELAQHPARPTVWPPAVTVGVAVVDAEAMPEIDLDALIATADAAMYARRRVRRGE